MSSKTIAVPQAMYYYEYGKIWEAFFAALGLEVICSGKTDAEILSYGVKHASSDLCLPVKAMFGHIGKLLNSEKKADYIFLPNIYITFKRCYTCPKTIGITDMLKASFDDLPQVISPSFYGNMKEFLLEAGALLGYTRFEALRAYGKAALKHNKTISVEKNCGITIALIGHSYVLADDFLNMRIQEKLNNMKVHCIEPSTVSSKKLAKLADSTEYKKPFWYSANRNLGFTKYVADNQKADGIIFLNSFGCGTDSLFLGFCHDYIRQHSEIPAITISLDEHTAEAGLVTRLEAFVDCIEAGKERNKAPERRWAV